LKILLVDDDENKARVIVEGISDVLGGGPQRSVAIATTLANGVRLLSLVAFDLVILDLMLPYIEGGESDSRAGLELLRELRKRDGPNKNTTVIAISAFPDEIALSRAGFDELGVLIIQFDDEGLWNRALLSVLQGIKGRTASQTNLDFLVICALEEERNGFAHTAVEKISEVIVSGLNVHYVRLPGRSELFGGIIRLSQMGLVAATFETTSALSAFRTRVLCMSGICAGFASETHLGQLVIASPAWEYQAGKWSANGFEIAPIQIPLRPATRSIIDQAIARDDFVRDLENGVDSSLVRPSRRARGLLAPFATGSAVIADSRRLEHIKMQHRKVAALDMETFGLYFAAHESTTSMEHFFSVKCVVDLADGDKGDNLHQYGCIISARATEQFLRALLIPN
jgi:adenosylhomocysteine nucleosidase